VRAREGERERERESENKPRFSEMNHNLELGETTAESFLLYFPVLNTACLHSRKEDIGGG
jgi:hypothetical protein